ncbi:MAG: Uma2 family endonuclease [Aggregatilineales bacterium]
MAAQPRTRISAVEYDLLPEYAQSDLIQLINGEVVISMPPVLKHQAIVGEILYLLMTTARRLGGKAYTSPVEVQLDDHNVFEPDVVFVSTDNLDITRRSDKRIIGAPDLVVEVLSPSTAKLDRQEKFQAYEAHGVKEYWIVDPAHEVVEVWNIGADGRYERRGVFADDDSLVSTVLGEQIGVRAIFNAQ